MILSDSALKYCMRIFIIDYYWDIHDMILCCIYVYCQLMVNGTTANKGHNLPHQNAVSTRSEFECINIVYAYSIVCLSYEIYFYKNSLFGRNHDLSLGMTDMDIFG